MPREVYNEGRVVGYSAYEIYVRHAVSEGMEPVDEKSWLSATLTDGSSMLMRLDPNMLDRDGNAINTSGSHIVDIPLPTAPSEYELTTREPSDWTNHWNRYYVPSQTVPGQYDQLATEPMPTWEAHKYFSAVGPTWVEDTYYAHIFSPDSYVLLTSEPANWATTWMNYYQTDDGGQTYYHVPAASYTESESIPGNWASTWKNYYTRSGVSPNFIYKKATSWKPNTYYQTVVTHIIAANTIVGSLFIGSGVYENGSYWASRVGDYGQLLDNETPLSSETYKDAEDVEPDSTFDFSSEAEKMLMYSTIVDGVVITPGTWKPNSSTPPGNDFIPDLSDSAGQQVVRLYLHSPLTTSIEVLLTGFMLKSVLGGWTSTTEGSIDTPNPEDGDFLGPQVFPWGNKIVFSAPSSLVDFIYKRRLTRNNVQESQVTIKNKSIIDIDYNHVAEYYGTGPYYQAPAQIRRQGVNATSDVPYDVLTIFNRNSILPPALYAYEINDSIESTESAYPVDTVAPGTVKIFTDDNKTSEAAAVNQIPGNVGMYRDSDYIIYQNTNVHSDPTPISDVSIVEFANDRPEGNGPCVIRHQSGSKYVAAISLSNDTAGGTLLLDGNGGSISPMSGYELTTEKPEKWEINYSSYYTHQAYSGYFSVEGIHYRLMTEPPADWSTDWGYTNYFKRTGSFPSYEYEELIYRPYPEWANDTYYIEVAPAWDSSKKYYEKIGNNYVLLTAEPGDWNTNWKAYFEDITPYWWAGDQPRVITVPSDYQVVNTPQGEEPTNWSAIWPNYFVRTQEGTEGQQPYYVYTRATNWRDNTFYEYTSDLVAPEWEPNAYYAAVGSHAGMIHWNDLLYALANNQSLDLFKNAYFRQQIFASLHEGLGIGISADEDDIITISNTLPYFEYADYTSAKAGPDEDFMFILPNGFVGYESLPEFSISSRADDGIGQMNLVRPYEEYGYRCSLSYLSAEDNSVASIKISGAASGYYIVKNSTAPEDWSTTYTSYYELIDGTYQRVTGATAPAYEPNKYYIHSTSKLGVGHVYDYEKLTGSAPSDWSDIHKVNTYYKKDSHGGYVPIPRNHILPYQSNTYYKRVSGPSSISSYNQNYPKCMGNSLGAWCYGNVDGTSFGPEGDDRNVLTTASGNYIFMPGDSPWTTSAQSPNILVGSDIEGTFAWLHILGDSNVESTHIYRRKSNIICIKFTNEMITKLFGSTHTLTTHEPDDWATNWTKYYTRSGVNPDYTYSPVTGATAPQWASNTYYVDTRNLYKFVNTSTSSTGIWNIHPAGVRARWQAACGIRANSDYYASGDIWAPTGFVYAYRQVSSAQTNRRRDYDLVICGFSYSDGYNSQFPYCYPSDQVAYDQQIRLWASQLNLNVSGMFRKVVDP